MATKQKLEKILNGIEQLKAMPDVVVKMLALVDDPNVSFRDLVKNLDVALATKFLQVANSAFYRTRQNIQSLEQAISVLGLNAIKNILIEINVTEFLSFESEDSTFDQKRFWKHAILTAHFSKILAKLIRFREFDKIYTIGLIHDMGRPFIAQYLPDEFTKIDAQVKTKEVDICEAEKEIVGMSHNEIGGLMAKKWDLTPEMAEVIKIHSNPEDKEEYEDEYKIALIIYTAEKIVNQVGSQLSYQSFTRSEHVNKLITQLVKKSSCTIQPSSTLQPHKVLSEWLEIIHNQLAQLEEDVSQVMGVLFKK